MLTTANDACPPFVPSTLIGARTSGVRAFLRFEDTGLHHEEFELAVVSTIGRGRESTVLLPPDVRAVSAMHATIRRSPGGLWTVEDRASKGGTYLNHEPITVGVRPVLRSGDVLTFGCGGPCATFTLRADDMTTLVGSRRRGSSADTIIAVAERIAKRRLRAPLLAAVVGIVLALLFSSAGWATRRDETPPRRVEVAAAASTTERFQGLQERVRPAVLLVQAGFAIRLRDAPNDPPIFTGDTFGTAVMVTRGGYAITNRHIVEPWVGVPEYALALAEARRTHGDDAIALDTFIAAWPAGSEALDERRSPRTEVGFNSHVLHNLSVVATPPLHLVELEHEGEIVKIVAPDHTDLALLLLEGYVVADESLPRLATSDDMPQVLDPVLSVGFAHGAATLEGTRAEPSPTIGEVRKIEETLQSSLPTYPGNSGSPVLTLDGVLVGVTTRRLGEGLSISIPAEKVRALLLRAGV